VPAKVVDASAVAALLFVEGEADFIAREFGDADLIAPALLDFEVANVCLKKIRTRHAERETLLQAFAQLREMAITTVDIAHDEALELADRTGLSVYDASYLWLALEMNADLVTLDSRLAAVAAQLAGQANVPR
jgi:predicted nucleic acid-binding protein